MASADPLPEKVMEAYRAPFLNPETRRPLWQYVHDLPLGEGGSDVIDHIEIYSDWLRTTELPKLMLYAIPGFITTVSTVQWARDNMLNLTQVELDDALHFAMETSPERFTGVISEWLLSR